METHILPALASLGISPILAPNTPRVRQATLALLLRTSETLAEGKQLLADLDKPLTSAGEKVAQPLKSSELQTLIALMEKIRNHLS